MVAMSLSKINELAKEVLDIEAKSILRLKNNIGEEFDKAIDILYNCKGRVIVTGMGKSGLIGKKIAATMSSTGTPTYFLHPAESTHGDSGVITRNDVIIAISNSGETQELLNLLPLIKRFGCEMIGMTGNLNSTLSKTSEVVLDISVEREACPLGKAPTASTTATLAMGDALAVCLMEKKGFTKEDFLLFHPSGKLGKGLTYKVRDLMITGDKMPLVSESESFKDVINTISEYKLGMAMVLNDDKTLAGVLTDGDIRRTVIKYPDTSNIKVKDVMTVNPKRITSDAYAASALNLMEKYSITALAVVDEGNVPVGVIHVHDLLRAGVA
ncbi:KpsF/GutQ family sugar-phosphate isomerase [Methanobrevibacter sp. UBA188]|jgi:arabinose-5-phosphate isomerase|uniref:KpsF/GutQ family sugar-phosphate isomerase n=1 Tax=Methanobrevibacter sp. UBA188 TaxID=1915473 RepID=UPI000338E4C0|nr:KpsF/GutQ family sugar-phosphate isomerase [Methanobrevibacter sp. UBA188]CDE91960.1 kpsF/GutQ family protein [Fusobacterium sp. CAG:815]